MRRGRDQPSLGTTSTPPDTDNENIGSQEYQNISTCDIINIEKALETFGTFL